FYPYMIQVIIIEFSVHSPTPLGTEPTAKLRILSLTICIPPPKPSLFPHYFLTIPSLQLFPHLIIIILRPIGAAAISLWL
ncbi:MAG: hypothetical protein SPG08_09070, partial [Sodaliphilus sp.]|nr:hypothetical protein [Bacteroidales bacterium]MDY5569191.1 hypothetical protein [Sodaliphilus sp.]